MDSIVKISFFNKHIIIILIIMILFFIAYNNAENFTISNESIVNLEKVYGRLNNKLYLNDINVDDIDALNFKGIIVIWSGTIDNIPSGWYLCDGTNGTPDLRSRFIYGASANKAVNSKGGYERVILDNSNLAKHSHDLNWDNWGCKGGFCSKPATAETKWVPIVLNTDRTPENKDISSNGVTTNNYTNWNTLPWTNPQINFIQGTGDIIRATPFNDKGHDNMPPYYALAYIMKK